MLQYCTQFSEKTHVPLIQTTMFFFFLFSALSDTVSDTVRLNIDRGEGGGGVHFLPTVSYFAGQWTAGRGEGLVADSVERRAPPRACRLVVVPLASDRCRGGGLDLPPVSVASSHGPQPTAFLPFLVYGWSLLAEAIVFSICARAGVSVT